MRIISAASALFIGALSSAGGASIKDGGNVLSLSCAELLVMDDQELARGLVTAAQHRDLNLANYEDFLFSRARSWQLGETLHRAIFADTLTDLEQASRMESVMGALMTLLRMDDPGEGKALYFFSLLFTAGKINVVLPLVSFHFAVNYADHILVAAMIAGKDHLVSQEDSPLSLIERIQPYLQYMMPLACYFSTKQTIIKLLDTLPADCFPLDAAIHTVALYGDDVELLETLMCRLEAEAQFMKIQSAQIIPLLMAECLEFGRFKAVAYFYERHYQPLERYPNGYCLRLCAYREIVKQDGNENVIKEFVRTFGPTIVASFSEELQSLYQIVRRNSLSELREFCLQSVHHKPAENKVAVEDLPILAIDESTVPEVAALLSIFTAVEAGNLTDLQVVLCSHAPVLEMFEWESVSLVRAVVNGHVPLVAFLLQSNASRTGYLLPRLDLRAFGDAACKAAHFYRRQDIIRLMRQMQLPGLPGWSEAPCGGPFQGDDARNN